MKSFLLILFTTLTLFTQAQDKVYYTYGNVETVLANGDSYYYIETTQLGPGEFEQKKFRVKTNDLLEVRKCKSINPLIFHGSRVLYNRYGGISGKATFYNHLATDTAYYYDEEGRLSLFTYYVNDTPIIEQEFYESGKLYYEMNYKNGLTKSIQYYYETGEKKRACFYNNKGEFRNGVCFTKNGLDTPYFSPKTQVSFALEDFNNNIYEFLVEKINYPQMAKVAGLNGLVVLSFAINQDNSFSDLMIVFSTSSIFEEEALRVMNLSAPFWKAGTNEGNPTSLRYTLPINFTLE